MDKELTFNKYKIDVTGISHAREEKAKLMWQKSFVDNKKKLQSAGYYNKKVNIIGSYMINQDMFILRRTLPFKSALKEWILRRIILNSRYINKQMKDNYDSFHNWVSEVITGMTLDDILKKNEMETLGLKMFKELRKDRSVEQCEELYLTFLQNGVRDLNISKVSQQSK